MWYIKFFDQNNRWFSTAWVYGYYTSDLSVAKQIKTEIDANLNHWQNPVIWRVYHSNQDVTDWYLSVINGG